MGQSPPVVEFPLVAASTAGGALRELGAFPQGAEPVGGSAEAETSDLERDGLRQQQPRDRHRV